MIDTHCHILPSLDDGPTDDEESLEMASIAANDGITGIIATPHVYDSRFSMDDIAAGVDRLNRLLSARNIPVEVLPGAEVAIGLDPHALCKYTISGTSYILIEFPHDHLPSHAGQLLQWLLARGLKPIIAHPERNYSVVRSPEALLPLLTQNIYLQITAGSITGDFGRDIAYCADFLLDSGKVDIIATDAHSKNGRRPLLSRAAETVKNRLGGTISERLVRTNPERLLAGMEIHVD
jgi:protein-tyrosine phosphatase